MRLGDPTHVMTVLVDVRRTEIEPWWGAWWFGTAERGRPTNSFEEMRGISVTGEFAC